MTEYEYSIQKIIFSLRFDLVPNLISQAYKLLEAEITEAGQKQISLPLFLKVSKGDKHLPFSGNVGSFHSWIIWCLVWPSRFFIPKDDITALETNSDNNRPSAGP